MTRQDDTQEVCRPGTQELADAAVEWARCRTREVVAFDDHDAYVAKNLTRDAEVVLMRLAAAYAEVDR